MNLSLMIMPSHPIEFRGQEPHDLHHRGPHSPTLRSSPGRRRCGGDRGARSSQHRLSYSHGFRHLNKYSSLYIYICHSAVTESESERDSRNGGFKHAVQVNLLGSCRGEFRSGSYLGQTTSWTGDTTTLSLSLSLTE